MEGAIRILVVALYIVIFICGPLLVLYKKSLKKFLFGPLQEPWDSNVPKRLHRLGYRLKNESEYKSEFLKAIIWLFLCGLATVSGALGLVIIIGVFFK